MRNNSSTTHTGNVANIREKKIYERLELLLPGLLALASGYEHPHIIQQTE